MSFVSWKDLFYFWFISHKHKVFGRGGVSDYCFCDSILLSNINTNSEATMMIRWQRQNSKSSSCVVTVEIYLAAIIAVLLLFITVNNGCYLGDIVPFNTPQKKIQLWTIV